MAKLHGQKLTDLFFRVISIDPGSGKAGYSVLDYDFNTEKFKVVYSNTMTGNYLSGLFIDKDIAKVQGERLSRNIGHKMFLGKLLEIYKPTLVVCEAAYVGRFVNAYKSLTEHVTLLKAAVYSYDSSMEYGMLEPSKVKAAMGVNGKSGDKMLMKKALDKRSDIGYNDGIKIDDLDEHAIDSICIGITACKIVHANFSKETKDKVGKKK